MNREPQFSLKHTSMVLLLLAAWFSLSNHCALLVLAQGISQAQSQEAHNCCSQNLPPSEKETPPSMPPGTCCKSLRVLLSDAPAKVVKSQDVGIPVVLFDTPWIELAPLCEFQRSVSGNTEAPPGSRTFAETVLQRSLLSHAPPRAI